MLSTTECMDLLKEEKIYFGDSLSLDCVRNVLFVSASGLQIQLNESQKRLMVCLFKRINCKRKIINIVWHEIHDRIKDNNYHQLVFQTRTLLTRNGLPENTLVTIHYYGVKLNDNIFIYPKTNHKRRICKIRSLFLVFKWIARLLSRATKR